MDNSLEAPKGFSSLWTLYAISFFLGLGNVIQVYRWLLKISSRIALTIFIAVCNGILTITFFIVYCVVEQQTYSTTSTTIRFHVPFYFATVFAVGYVALAFAIYFIKSRAQHQRIVFETPPYWKPMFINKEKFRLKKKSLEYKEVEDRFRRTTESDKYEITCIHRIQNKELFEQFIVARENMKSQKSQKKERWLWHGTSADVVENINKGGFNRSYCGKNATVYGKGVYFAKKANYSSQDTYAPKDSDGNKLMYLCRVLTGDYVEGERNMREPPEREKGVRYHSVVDDAQNPTIFVIFKDAQAYPDYLVKFHEKIDDF